MRSPIEAIGNIASVISVEVKNYRRNKQRLKTEKEKKREVISRFSSVQPEIFSRGGILTYEDSDSSDILLSVFQIDLREIATLLEQAGINIPENPIVQTTKDRVVIVLYTKSDRQQTKH